MRRGLRARPWVGLDIGRFSVKVVASSPAVGGPQLRRAEISLPADGGSDAPPAPDLIARAIADAFAAINLSVRNVRGITLGISGADVIVKQIQLPYLTDDEVGPALRFEARKHLPFDLQSMTIDFQILGRSMSEKRLDVLLAAVSHDRLQKQLAPLKSLGVDPDIVDAAPLALTNGILTALGSDREPVALLDFGFSSSHLMLYQKGEPYFSRRLDFGGRTLTQAIASGTRVPYEEAEEWKLSAGSDQPGFRVDWHSAEMEAIHDSLRRELVDDLRRSFAFYGTLGQLPENMRLWISGSTARLPGLSIRLGDLLGLPVALFNPLERGGTAPDGEIVSTGPQFALAYGLSTRTA